MGIPLFPEEGISDGITRKDILQRHANLSQIDFWRLGYVAEYISELASKNGEHSQLSDKKVFNLIEKHIANKNIDFSKVNEKLRESIEHARIKYGSRA